jgi:hypothetical protein
MITVIDANLGELPRLHEAFGFDVHGVAIDAVVLPDEWKRRAITARNANTGSGTGWCAEAHDLAASKLPAFRDKDRDFVRVLIAEELVEPRKLLLRIKGLPTSDRLPGALRIAIVGWAKGTVRDLGRATWRQCGGIGGA